MPQTGPAGEEGMEMKTAKFLIRWAQVKGYCLIRLHGLAVDLARIGIEPAGVGR